MLSSEMQRLWGKDACSVYPRKQTAMLERRRYVHKKSLNRLLVWAHLVCPNYVENVVGAVAQFIYSL